MGISRGDRSGNWGTSRPYTGGGGLDARRDKFQRVRQKSIRRDILVAMIIVIKTAAISLVAITLHNQSTRPGLTPATGDSPAERSGISIRGSSILRRIKRRSGWRSTAATGDGGGGPGGWGFDLQRRRFRFLFGVCLPVSPSPLSLPLALCGVSAHGVNCRASKVVHVFRDQSFNLSFIAVRLPSCRLAAVYVHRLVQITILPLPLRNHLLSTIVIMIVKINKNKTKTKMVIWCLTVSGVKISNFLPLGIAQ